VKSLRRFQKGEIMKFTKTALLLLATCLTAPAFAQETPAPAAADTAED